MPHPVGGERSAVPTRPHDPCLVCHRAICSGFCSGVRTPAESLLLPQRPGSWVLTPLRRARSAPRCLPHQFCVPQSAVGARTLLREYAMGPLLPWVLSRLPSVWPRREGWSLCVSDLPGGSSVRSSQAQLGRRGQDALQPGTPRLRQPLLPRCRLPPGLCWVREMGGVVGTVCLVRASCPRALGWADRLSPLGFNTQRKNPFLPPLCDTDSPLYLLGCFGVQGTLTEQKASKWKNNP